MPPDPRAKILHDRERLRHMLEAAKDAVAFAQGRSRADLDGDRMLSHALVHCVQVIGEAAARVSQISRELYPRLPWAKIVGMRHILIHSYFEIDACSLASGNGAVAGFDTRTTRSSEMIPDPKEA